MSGGLVFPCCSVPLSSPLISLLCFFVLSFTNCLVAENKWSHKVKNQGNIIQKLLHYVMLSYLFGDQGPRISQKIWQLGGNFKHFGVKIKGLGDLNLQLKSFSAVCYTNSQQPLTKLMLTHTQAQMTQFLFFSQVAHIHPVYTLWTCKQEKKQMESDIHICVLEHIHVLYSCECTDQN